MDGRAQQKLGIAGQNVDGLLVGKKPSGCGLGRFFRRGFLETASRRSPRGLSRRGGREKGKAPGQSQGQRPAAAASGGLFFFARRYHQTLSFFGRGFWRA
jgi:hypothetical protein